MIYDKKNYTIGLDYIFNQYIREYDISKANISVLFSKGIIDQNLYTTLYNADRMTRQVYIGMMIKSNSNIQTILNEGIIEAKQNLFEYNNINDSDVLSIKNDAVFLLNKIPKELSFNGITFVHKNTYTSFMKLANLEIYYGSNMNNEIIDVKGIKDNDLEIYHIDFLNIIIDYFRYIQKDGPEIALRYITSVIHEYVNKRLPINVYRRFRSSNDYVLNLRTMSYGVLYIEDNEYNRNNIDISYNFNILKMIHIYTSQVLYEQKIRE